MEKTKSAAPPTGCFKCGRPGHWSRDCPSSSSSTSAPVPSNNTGGVGRNISTSTGGVGVKEKPKKFPRTRPKLTPDLLLSDDGLGFILRYFPRNFKFRGRSHEVSDLGHLIGLYSEWHSHLLPYYSFDQFIHKVEQVSASRHAKTCIRDLRKRIASGADPTKLHDGLTDEQAPTEAMGPERQLHKDLPLNDHAAADIHEDLFHEIYMKATEEQSRSDMNVDNVVSIGSSKNGSPDQLTGSCPVLASNEVNITEEQRSRMEANRLKALERAAARKCQLQPQPS